MTEIPISEEPIGGGISDIGFREIEAVV